MAVHFSLLTFRYYIALRVDLRGAVGCLPENGFAGSNLRSREPLIAAESRGAMVDDSMTRVESSTTKPSLSTYSRNVTLPCTFSAYNAGGYLKGMILFSMIGYVSGRAVPASKPV